MYTICIFFNKNFFCYHIAIYHIKYNQCYNHMYGLFFDLYIFFFLQSKHGGLLAKMCVFVFLFFFFCTNKYNHQNSTPGHCCITVLFEHVYIIVYSIVCTWINLFILFFVFESINMHLLHITKIFLNIFFCTLLCNNSYYLKKEKIKRKL